MRDVNTTDVVTAAVEQIVVGGVTSGLTLGNSLLQDMLVVNSHVIPADQNVGLLTWTFDSAAESFDYLAPGEELLLTYTIVVRDSHNESDMQDVTIVIRGTNDAPSLTVGAMHVDENSSEGTAIGTLWADDLDDSDVVSFSLLDDADGRFEIDPVTGSLEVAQSDSLDFETMSSHQVLARATDMFGAVADLWFTVVVENVNEAPVVNNHYYVTDYLTPLRFETAELLGRAVDAEGDPLTVQLLQTTETGTLLVESHGGFYYWPAVHGIGQFTFVVEVSDGALATQATHTIEVVRPVLLPPGFGDLSGPHNQAFHDGESGQIGANDNHSENQLPSTPPGDSSSRGDTEDGGPDLQVSHDQGATSSDGSSTDSPGGFPPGGQHAAHALGKPAFAVKRITWARGTTNELEDMEWRTSTETGGWQPSSLGRTFEVSRTRRAISDPSSADTWLPSSEYAHEATFRVGGEQPSDWTVDWTEHHEVAVSLGVTTAWLVFHGRVMAAAAATDALREAIDPTRLLNRWGKA